MRTASTKPVNSVQEEGLRVGAIATAATPPHVESDPLPPRSQEAPRDEDAATSKPSAGTEGNLGATAIKGGGYLLVREGIGMVIRLAGVVLTVRAIGPAGFGIYSAAAAYVLFISTIAQMGTEIYLIRLPRNLERRDFDQAFTFLLCTSVLATTVSLGLTFLLAPWLRPIGVLLPLRILVLSIPINVLWAPAQAAIERRFQYRRMGLLELGGDLVLYGTAVPLALEGAGAWSLIAGFFAWQSWLLVGSLVLAGLRPRLDWSRNAMRELVRHGLTFSASSWMFRLGELAKPLVVGTFAGAVGVGYVSFAQRLVDTIGFAQRGAFRLGLAAMSRVNTDDKARIRYGLEEGSLLQLLAVGIPFAVFSIGARWIIPAVFGHQWLQATPIYSLLALAVVLNASGIIQTTFLLSRGRNVAIVGTALIQSTTIFVASVGLVRWLGVEGYGIATIIALADLIYTDRMVRRSVTFSYRSLLPFAAVIIPLVLFPLTPLPWSGLLFLPLVVAPIFPSVRRQVHRLSSLVRSSLGRVAPA